MDPLHITQEAKRIELCYTYPKHHLTKEKPYTYIMSFMSYDLKSSIKA